MTGPVRSRRRVRALLPLLLAGALAGPLLACGGDDAPPADVAPTTAPSGPSLSLIHI